MRTVFIIMVVFFLSSLSPAWAEVSVQPWMGGSGENGYSAFKAGATISFPFGKSAQVADVPERVMVAQERKYLKIGGDPVDPTLCNREAVSRYLLPDDAYVSTVSYDRTVSAGWIQEGEEIGILKNGKKVICRCGNSVVFLRTAQAAPATKTEPKPEPKPTPAPVQQAQAPAPAPTPTPALQPLVQQPASAPTPAPQPRSLVETSQSDEPWCGIVCKTILSVAVVGGLVYLYEDLADDNDNDQQVVVRGRNAPAAKERRDRNDKGGPGGKPGGPGGKP